MKSNVKKSLFIGLVLWMTNFSIQAQEIIPFKKLGELKTVSSNDIKESRWSIGGETLDRDYADYHAYKEYLGPLGAKRIRLQGGWAKCEQVKGVYDFEWLDGIVDDAISRGVQPWIQTSYGNPIYEGGGEAALAGGIPTSAEALVAWDKWVKALVSRYKDKVNEWEIWNEPDISKRFTAEEFAEFHVNTANTIKEEQPEARIIALGLAGLKNVEYVALILEILKEKGKLDQFDVLTFHGYTARPEAIYDQVANLRALVKSYRKDIELWQGENGAPSTPKGAAVGALTREDWSETTQAKYVLRRMTADMGHDVDVTNVFQISDMHYKPGDHMSGLNSKGLLKANPDNSIDRPKKSYSAFRNVASVFSGKIERIQDLQVNKEESLSVFAYNKNGTNGNAITLWFSEAKPEDEYPLKMTNIEIQEIKLDNPIFIDLLDGSVYELPKANYHRNGRGYAFKNIPVGDWPVVIIDRSWVDFN